MTEERFLQICELSLTKKYDSTDKINYVGNKRVYQYRYKNDLDLLVDGLNFDGNEIYDQRYGIFHICCLIHFNIFTKKQWHKLLPYIFFEEFNCEYDELVQELTPMLDKISRWKKDLHLEFWQGIFSFGNHWCVKDKSIEESINSPENGELYCNTLLEIYPILKKFIDKHSNIPVHSTLMHRLS